MKLPPSRPPQSLRHHHAGQSRDAPSARSTSRTARRARRPSTKLYDNLDFTHAYRRVHEHLCRASASTPLRKGMLSIGVKDNEVLVFSELMDAKSLFLTANADTIYFIGFARSHQRTHGARGAAQGAWHHRRLLVPLGHRFWPARPRSRRGREVSDPAAGLRRPAAGRRVLRRPRPHQHTSCGSVARSWRTRTIPKPAAESIRKFTKVYPYEAGGVGTPIAEFLAAKPSSANHAAAADRVPRRQRQGDEHHSAERLELLRDAQRDRAAGTGHLARPRADGPDRRHRHRQGQALRARRADEEDHDRSARGRQCRPRAPCS